MIAPYPAVDARRIDAGAEGRMAAVMGVVTAIRNIRGEMRVAPGVSLSVTIRPAGAVASLFADNRRRRGRAARRPGPALDRPARVRGLDADRGLGTRRGRGRRRHRGRGGHAAAGTWPAGSGLARRARPELAHVPRLAPAPGAHR